MESLGLEIIDAEQFRCHKSSTIFGLRCFYSEAPSKRWPQSDRHRSKSIRGRFQRRVGQRLSIPDVEADVENYRFTVHKKGKLSAGAGQEGEAAYRVIGGRRADPEASGVRRQNLNRPPVIEAEHVASFLPLFSFFVPFLGIAVDDDEMLGRVVQRSQSRLLQQSGQEGVFRQPAILFLPQLQRDRQVRVVRVEGEKIARRSG